MGDSNSTEDDQFRRNIRTTDPLSPEAERLALHLPPGFEIQLFASEPDIAKPLNMSFDNKGRMWLTQSYEYPFPDTTGIGKDKISILEDTDGNGSADKITVFADSLNIPIGIQVVPDGVIAYSIPSIWHLMDHNGDDKVDERKVLYSGFKYGDTHGMVNNFVRSWDGWIHADHGFSNTSTVAGSDGDTIVMQSGNTFRFRMDGSRVEFTTTGRVNPYGYAYDELGYTYSVDCHTSPVYQLIRGADYPHFGKKPTGIGFGPALMKHDYGSTALAGLDYYIADQFPAAYRNNFYYGDVVRSRVSRNNFQMHGTTPVIHQEEDFVISDDPWFRPVDVKLGPDGALYIADFYNRIIGHYEVPLDHPGRDRRRGRIWRIIYTGGSEHTPPVQMDYSALDLPALIEQLSNPNLPLRMTFADQIVDRLGDTAIPELKKLIIENQVSPFAQIQALWILYRLHGLDEQILEKMIRHENDTIKVHSLRVLFELKNVDEKLLSIVEEYLHHPDPHVQRQAVMVLSQHPSDSHIPMLVELLKTSDSTDTHFYYSTRQSLRDQIRNKSVLDWVLEQDWASDDSRFIADVMVGVDAPQAGRFLLNHLVENKEPLSNQILYTKHAARWLPAKALDELAQTLRQANRSNSDDQYQIFLALLEGARQAGNQLGATGQSWANILAAEFLQDPIAQYGQWKTIPIDRQPYASNTWNVIDTTSENKENRVVFLSSNKMNGQGNGISIMQSSPFEMPSQLEFMLRGRKNNPGEDQPFSPPTNRIELVKYTDELILFTAEINQFAVDTLIRWNANSDIAGTQVFIRMIDGSSAGGEYIAIGDLNPDVVALPLQDPERIVERQIFAAEMVGDYQIESLIIPLQQLLDSEIPDVLVRNAAAGSLIKLDPDKSLTSIKQILTNNPPLRLKELLLVTLSSSNKKIAHELIPAYMQEIPYQAQKEIVMNIGQNTSGIDYLLEAVSTVSINPRLLIEPQVSERLAFKMNSRQKQRLEKLSSDLTPPAGEIDAEINKRLRGYVSTAYSTDKGQVLFGVFCGVCHEINGQSGNIGPQLSGVGNWGARALCEKILDPNRNISKAFVTYTVQLKDGSVQSGLLRREEGETLVFANEQGQEFTIEKNNIAEQKVSPYTLMPSHFRQTIPVEDFNHLLAYLLNLKAG
jgi:putative heme-binding domain-containing protein